MQLGEIVAHGAHQTNDDCPFCKDAVDPDLKTYAGKDNDSKVLAPNMRDGTTSQSRAGNEKCAMVDLGDGGAAPKPELTIDAEDGHNYGFSFQAHHAISGKQAMKGEEIEGWLIKDKEVANDSGYNINSPTNGIWLPSKLNQKNGSSFKWANFAKSGNAELTRLIKRKLAYYAMKRTGSQWHLGHHRIEVSRADYPDEAWDKLVALVRSVETGQSGLQQKSFHREDPNDLEDLPEEEDTADDEEGGGTYDKYLKDELKEIQIHVGRWKTACEDAKEQDKPPVNPRANIPIDALSRSVRNKLRTRTTWEKWDRFISRPAWEYTTIRASLRKPTPASDKRS